MTIILSIIVGFIFLYSGAGALVKGSSDIALKMGISQLMVGLTVVAFGTSVPELIVSLKAAIADTGDISLGNIVGSNICNIGLILGFSALIRPLRIQFQTIRFDIPFMIGATIVFLFFSWGSQLNRLEGMLLFIGFIIFIIFNRFFIHKAIQGTSGKKCKDRLSLSDGKLWKSIVQIGVGILFLFTGAHFLIKGSIQAAKHFGMSEAFVGLTIIALGTSLPELATSVMASWKGHKDIAVGNIIGSNIFNILCISGITCLVHPIQVYDITFFDLLFMLGLSILIFPLMRTGFTLKRWEGALMIGLYFFYLYLKVLKI